VSLTVLEDPAPPTPRLPHAGAVMSQARAENFPVGGLLLGRRLNRDLLALYGFARLVDDVGDEASGDRLVLLDDLERDLDLIYRGGVPTHPVLQRLVPTVWEHMLPADPFLRLIEANRMDQAVSRYATFADLLGYCRLSADPVGELVLRVSGAASPQAIGLSDRICSALQVVEHLQDVGEDYARGRIYLPAETLARTGCREADLAAPSAGPGLRRAVEELAGRARAMLVQGRPLLGHLGGRPRLAVAGFIAGGEATLDALELGAYDVLGARPRRTRSGMARALARVLASAGRSEGSAATAAAQEGR
jgi:squalene synthase HpnC